MKSTGIIMQDFSIAGIKKQWEYQQFLQKAGEGLPKGFEPGGIIYPVGKDVNGREKRVIGPDFRFGCKTETRRTRGLDKVNENPDGWELWNVFVENGETVNPMVFQDGRVVWNFANTGEFKNHQIAIQCPYGVVGDELWVKEGYVQSVDGVIYKQNFSNDTVKIAENKGTMRQEIKWKSPLFMPKAASRIKLEITGISIERLQDITEEGALREGVYKHGEDVWAVGEISGPGTCYYAPHSAVNLYNNVWKDLHGEDSWNLNPWVWVIQFTVKEFKI